MTDILLGKGILVINLILYAEKLNATCSFKYLNLATKKELNSFFLPYSAILKSRPTYDHGEGGKSEFHANFPFEIPLCKMCKKKKIERKQTDVGITNRI